MKEFTKKQKGNGSFGVNDAIQWALATCLSRWREPAQRSNFLKIFKIFDFLDFVPVFMDSTQDSSPRHNLRHRFRRVSSSLSRFSSSLSRFHRCRLVFVAYRYRSYFHRRRHLVFIDSLRRISLLRYYRYCTARTTSPIAMYCCIILHLHA